MFYTATAVRYASDIQLNIKLATGRQGQIQTPYISITYSYSLDESIDINSTASVSSSTHYSVWMFCCTIQMWSSFLKNYTIFCAEFQDKKFCTTFPKQNPVWRFLFCILLK